MTDVEINRRKIWSIHLEDNRENGKNIDSDEKFNTCKIHNILAIGWQDCDTDDTCAYKKAYNALKKMSKGDLVWVKNPQKQEYYICEILNNRMIDFDKELAAFDVSTGRIAEFHRVDEKDLPKDKIPFPRQTIQQIRMKPENYNLIMETILLFERISEN